MKVFFKELNRVLQFIVKNIVAILTIIFFILSLCSFVYAGFLLCKFVGYIVLGVVFLIITYILDKNA